MIKDYEYGRHLCPVDWKAYGRRRGWSVPDDDEACYLHCEVDSSSDCDGTFYYLTGGGVWVCDECKEVLADAEIMEAVYVR